MFVFRHYKETDVFNNTYEGYEVGYFYWEQNNLTKQWIQKFQRVRTFVDIKCAEKYIHWLNGGASYKYDNVRSEN